VLVCACLMSCVCALRYSVVLLCSATGCLAACVRALRYTVVFLCCAFWIWPHYLCSSDLCWDRGAVVLVRHCVCAPLYNRMDGGGGTQTGYGSVDSLGESAKINKISSLPTMAQITHHIHHYFYLSQRRQLCGMLYLATHNTQLSGSEIVQLLELIQNLSNNYLDLLLDFMLDVPSSQPGQPLGSPARTSSRMSSPYKNGIETKVEFDRELMLQMHLSRYYGTSVV
jgi:hypothetical protein